MENTLLSLAERRSRRQVQLPKRFRDFVPNALPELPPVLPPPDSSTNDLIADNIAAQSFIESPRNAFGLFRRYSGNRLPTHDPEEHIDLLSLTNTIALSAETFVGDKRSQPDLGLPMHEDYGPYPNRNSFLLGAWYHEDGAQKSQNSFRKLIDIVGSPTFRPEDVRDTKWSHLHRVLGQNEFDIETTKEESKEEWEWTDKDAGWIRTDVSINVPFNRGMTHPGVHQFVVKDFYHRSLVSVIREKLANSRDDAQFHYEPYELHWKPNAGAPDVRVQGELYTSPVFLAAHKKLQDGPGEPGCTLPRVVVAMMFSSDATHLTSFGSAKLWPCYLYFGNESKYRRGKPTANLCNHVAYFETVSSMFILCYTPSDGINVILVA